ncbi:MAG: ADOP family duplicated permease [Acidobacteriota bacterium]
MGWINRLSNLVRQRDLNPEIDEELQFHLDARIQDNMASGMSDEEARRDALLRFGGRASLREKTRDANVFVALESFGQDVTFAARSLRQRPWFTAVALATLALGIGANTAIFTIVQGVLIRPLPFVESERLHIVSYADLRSPFWLYPSLADDQYLAFKKIDRAFESLTSFANAPFTLSGAGDAVRVSAAQVTTDFFRVLRVNPVLGRSFAADDDQPGRDRIALLGHTLWRSRFGANPDLVNQAITLDGTSYTVVGILPPEFSYPPATELWTPLAIRAQEHLTFSRPVIGRLKAGVSRVQAQAELETFVASLPQPAEGQWTAQVTPLKRAVAGDSSRSLLIFAGAVGLVLLIACANTSNLFLIRAFSWRQEIATRLALGASRARVMRQLLTESIVLALAGGLSGALLVAVGLPALLTLIPPGQLPRDGEIHMDAWTVALTAGLSLVIGLAVGLGPAFQATRGDLAGAIKQRWDSGTRDARRLRQSLVVAEIAVALVLVVGAGLLVRSLVKLRSVDPGFRPEQVMSMMLNLPASRYPTAPDLQAFHDRMLASFSTLSDVTVASSVNWQPFGPLSLRGDFSVEEPYRIPPSYNVTKVSVSPGYFRTLDIRLEAGRDFTDRDDASAAGVAIVSHAVARLVWPNDDPIGKRLSLEGKPKPSDWLTIIGVVDDVRQRSLKEAVVPAVYRPYRQTSRASFLNHVSFLVRTRGDPAALAPAMRGVLQAVDKDQAPQRLAKLQDTVAGTIAEPRFYTRLLLILSTLALLLAAIGIYSVLASAVAERRREIGIRVALGAEPGKVVRMVLDQTLRLAGLGLAIGVAGALALNGILETLLFEVAPTDLPTFAGAGALLLVVAVLASLVPARRATRVDPLIVLKSL